LTTILATQRPRDIPEDVLSQMGMFVVHRLINEKDRQVVESACGNLDASAAAFIPTLGQGEAILVGVDFPMPTPVKIIEPEYPPKSEGPRYSDFWRATHSSQVCPEQAASISNPCLAHHLLADQLALES
jgi:DNA helicase HerA-like ATPase